jgi:hypothetical protein
MTIMHGQLANARDSFFYNEWWYIVGGTWLQRSFLIKSSFFLSLYLLLPFIWENISFKLPSVRSRINAIVMVSPTFLLLFLSISVSIFLLRFFSQTTRFLSLYSGFYSSLLSFSSKTHYDDHEEENIRIPNDQKKRRRRRQDKRIWERPILTKHNYYSTRISFLYEVTICYSYRFDMRLMFNFIQIVNKRMLN